MITPGKLMPITHTPETGAMSCQSHWATEVLDAHIQGKNISNKKNLD